MVLNFCTLGTKYFSLLLFDLLNQFQIRLCISMGGSYMQFSSYQIRLKTKFVGAGGIC